MTRVRAGLVFGVTAYALWGSFPLYWPLLEPAGALEILAHRMVWSLLTMSLLVLVTGRWRQVRAVMVDPRTRRLLTLAAVVITVNWGMFIFGVTSGRVVETSLGYFINPLVTVLLGVVVLGERLRRGQWLALGLALLAVLGLTVEYGHPPWVALVLAFSFGTYGLAKKQAGVEAVEALTFETLVMVGPALAFLVWLEATGRGHFATDGLGHALLLTTTGLVTAVPLLCFGAAAIRLPMSTIGPLQYLTPSIQFLLGVLVFHEQMSALRWVGFAGVWVALVLFTAEALRHRHRQLRLTAEAAAT